MRYKYWNIEEFTKSRDLTYRVFTVKLTLLENEFRTTRINEDARIVYKINKGLDPNKNKKKGSFFFLPSSDRDGV